MKFNIKQTISAVAFVLSVLLVIGTMKIYHDWDNPKHIPVIQSDPIADTIISIRHQGKLVVTDENIRAETKSHLDSSLWDASVSSSATARIQVFVDLNIFQKEWVTVNGSNVNVVIPRSAIKTEVIDTGEEHHSNGSWAFTFEGGEEKNLETINHIRLADQLQKETLPAIEYSIPMVELHFMRLFSVALTNTPYHVKVAVSSVK